MAISLPLGVTFSKPLLNLWYPRAPRLGFLSTFMAASGLVFGDSVALDAIVLGTLVATGVKVRFGG
jgi:hypothetical protein